MAIAPIRIRLMPDYCAFPLLRDGGMVHPSDLPLQSETVVRLTRWAAVFDSKLNWKDPNTTEPWLPDVLEAFEREGLSLWKQVRRELGPAYLVSYRSQLTGDELLPSTT